MNYIPYFMLFMIILMNQIQCKITGYTTSEATSGGPGLLAQQIWARQNQVLWTIVQKVLKGMLPRMLARRTALLRISS